VKVIYPVSTSLRGSAYSLQLLILNLLNLPVNILLDKVSHLNLLSSHSDRSLGSGVEVSWFVTSVYFAGCVVLMPCLGVSFVEGCLIVRCLIPQIRPRPMNAFLRCHPANHTQWMCAAAPLPGQPPAKIFEPFLVSCLDNTTALSDEFMSITHFMTFLA